MSAEPDLFASLAYPARPGARRSRTSQAAAKAMTPKAPTLRDRVLAIIQQTHATADEVAAIMGVSLLSIRPRCAELHKMGLIVDTGATRRNASGLKAIVWRAI